MMTTTLYVTEPGTNINKVDERLVLRREKRVVSDVPLINLRQVAIIGRGIEISTEALLALVARNIDVCFFSRSMQLRARVSGEVSLFGQLRFAQARYVDDPARQLTLAKVLVQGKLQNQQTALPPTQREAIRGIGQLAERLAVARDLDSLRGYEGQGAALYFEALRRAFPLLREMGFARRAYYPPPDPVNALFSYGYSLITREALAAVYLVGFDPYLGFFHAINYGRPSLALDVVEEFRPVLVDSMVLQLLNEQLITPTDFERTKIAALPTPSTEAENEPEEVAGLVRAAPAAVTTWRLKPAARNRFLEFYERRMAEYVFYPPENRQHTLRRVVELQVRQLRSLILGETGQYQPFTPR